MYACSISGEIILCDFLSPWKHISLLHLFQLCGFSIKTVKAASADDCAETRKKLVFSYYH